MKVLKVTEICNGCGMCVVQAGDYLRENSDGLAVPVEGKAVSNEDMNRLSGVVAECPCNALKIVDISTTSAKGKEGIRALIQKLQKTLAEFKVTPVQKSDISMVKDSYPVNISSYSSKEYSSKFSSEGQARSAARDEFMRNCYNESVYRPILKQVFVEYKVEKLRPYYTNEDKEGNVYYPYNEKIRRVLAEIYAELQEVCEGKCSLSEEWKNFSVYLNDDCTSSLANFDDRSMNSGIIAELKNGGYNTSVDYYVNVMDFEYEEIYKGEGFFGSKMEKKWYFTGFYRAAEEFSKDLKHAIKMQAYDISDVACDLVKDALETFERKVKNELENKIRELERLL